MWERLRAGKWVGYGVVTNGEAGIDGLSPSGAAPVRVDEQQTSAKVVGVDPPMIAASGTFIDELITVAGGRNLFPELKLWPQVNLEEVLQRDPDVVILADVLRRHIHGL